MSSSNAQPALDDETSDNDMIIQANTVKFKIHRRAKAAAPHQCGTTKNAPTAQSWLKSAVQISQIYTPAVYSFLYKKFLLETQEVFKF